MDYGVDVHRYLAHQLNGHKARSLIYAALAVFEELTSALEYMNNHKLYYGHIKKQDLDWLGKLLAIPRPYTLSGGEDQRLLYGVANGTYTKLYRELHALSNGANDMVGGLFNSVTELGSTKTVSDPVYIQYITDVVALRKVQGLSGICTLVEDVVAPQVGRAYVSQYYTVAFDDTRCNDIVITLDTIFKRYADYLQRAFDSVFNECPQVHIAIAEVHV